MKARLLMMAMMMVMVACGFTGCGTGATTAEGVRPPGAAYKETMLVACTAAAAANDAATVGIQSGKIDDDDTINKISAAADVVEPICGADDYPTLSEDGMTGFMKAVTVLQEAERRVSQ